MIFEQPQFTWVFNAKEPVLKRARAGGKTKITESTL